MFAVPVSEVSVDFSAKGGGQLKATLEGDTLTWLEDGNKWTRRNSPGHTQKSSVGETYALIKWSYKCCHRLLCPFLFRAHPGLASTLSPGALGKHDILT